MRLEESQPQAWVITVKDLSQRNALLDDLQSSRADMERVLESVEEYLYTYELAADGTSSLVRELSRPVARILERRCLRLRRHRRALARGDAPR